MTKSNFQKVYELFEKFGIPHYTTPAIALNNEDFQFRLQLIMEETMELLDAHRKKDLVEFADAIGDLLYVTYGMAVMTGIDIDAVFEEIHSSNMKKVRALTTNNKRGSKIDIVKPLGWAPPDIRSVLRGLSKREGDAEQAKREEN